MMTSYGHKLRPLRPPLPPPPLPLSSRMRGPIPIPRTEPTPVKTGTTIHLSSQLPSDTPAPPPIVLADAGTHPRPLHRARPREDGDDNPSFVPAPFRYSRAPSRCPRGCGDPSPSPRRAYPHEDEGGNPPPYPHLPVQMTNPTLFSRPLPPCPEDSVHQSISP